MSKGSKKNYSDFSLVNYFFDQKPWQVSGSVKNCLACRQLEEEDLELPSFNWNLR
jgi:hypothetical protein